MEKLAVFTDGFIHNEGRYMQPALGFESDPLDSTPMLSEDEQEEIIVKQRQGND